MRVVNCLLPLFILIAYAKLIDYCHSLQSDFKTTFIYGKRDSEIIQRTKLNREYAEGEINVCGSEWHESEKREREPTRNNRECASRAPWHASHVTLVTLAPYMNSTY